MKLLSGVKKRRFLKERLRSLAEKISLPTRVTGILVSVLSMHLLVVRPLVDRVDRLEKELHHVDQTLSKVAGSASTIQETNDLLSNLKKQHEEIARARATVRQLELLREEISSEAEEIPAAIESLKRMSELPERVLQSEMDRYSALPDVLNSSQQTSPSLESKPIRIQDFLAENIDSDLLNPKTKKISPPKSASSTQHPQQLR